MKKFVSLLLAALLVLSLTACGSKNNHSGDKPATPTSALNILETVWNTYGEDEKFSVVGGDFSEANLKEDAPGVFDLKDRALADSELGLPETAAVDEAASLVHMMNANTFTAASRRNAARCAQRITEWPRRRRRGRRRCRSGES